MSFKPVPEASLPAGIDAQFNKTKGNLFYKKGAGFLGPLLAKRRVVWTRDLSTAAVSNNVLYWNPDFYMKIDTDTRITVLAHELWHPGLLHGARMNQRDPELWNEAGDHVINLMLKEHGYYMAGFPYLMDPQYAGMSTDEVYDLLVKAKENGGGPTPNPMGQDIMPMNSDEVAEAVTEVVGAMTTARMTGKPGDIPGEITMIIDQFLNPKLPWQTILFNFFNAMTSEEYSYARPNRRFYDPIVPGVTGRNGLEHLIYYLDISGSITDDDILRFNSEVKYIQEELQPERLTLVTFDTRIQDVYEFERDDPFEKITVTGRGGTDLTEVFEHAAKLNPTAMVVFTDLYVAIPPKPEVPIVWVCINRPDAGVPYGQLVHVDT